MSLARIERIKLLATALNSAAGSCFTVGIATPVAGYLYNIGGLRTVVEPSTMVLGVAVWFLAAVGLHLLGRRALRNLDR